MLLLSWLLAACGPAAALPTLVPTLTPRPSATPAPRSPTPLIHFGGPSPTTPPATALAPPPTPAATATPLIALPPSPTPISPLAPLVFVPAGQFRMGSAPGLDPLADAWERPAHTVAVSAFWMEALPVTNSRYALCVLVGQCAPPLATATRTRRDYYNDPGYAEYPMVNVAWDQAQAFCAWAGGRLPTEAEWEYAARFNDGRRYPWGNAVPDPNRGNFGRPEADTAPVGAYPAGATALGLLDMAGNVWQWVADWYDPGYYAVSPTQDPPGPASGRERVVRGGAFATDAQFVRAANRFARDPNKGYNNIGFRCVSTAPAPNARRLPTLTPAAP